MTEINKQINEYRARFKTDLYEDLIKYANDRDENVQKNFLNFRIMHIKKPKNQCEGAYWNTVNNPIGKISMEFFLILCTGLPLEFVLFKLVKERNVIKPGLKS